MNYTSQASLRATFDRSAAPPRLQSLRHLVVEYVPPQTAESASAPRVPLNLALVIDASGSMNGGRLDAAVEAASQVVDQLGPEDRLSVVSFASDVQTHVRAQRMDELGRMAANSALRELSTRGCTDLSGGWLQGAKCVATMMDSVLPARNHVVLLSDGHANRGICGASELAQHAAALRDRGLLSSTVGIGAGYCTTQLEAIAEHGGGRLHHAAHPEEIAAVLIGELDDARSAVVHDLELEVTIPGDIRGEVANACPVHVEDNRFRCQLGSVLPGSTRRLVISCMFSDRVEGDHVPIGVSASWRTPGSDERASLETDATLLITANALELEKRDIDASTHAARAWLAVSERRLVEMNRAGLLEDARVYHQAQRRPFEDLCGDLPDGGNLLRAMNRAECLAVQDVPELSRKEIAMAAHKAMRGEIDKRKR